MDAVAFPPPPAPFLDDDFDFGDFTFASAPLADPQPAAFAAFDDDWGDFVASPLGSNTEAASSAPPTPPTATSTASWEKPRGPLPLSLFGADDQEEDGREEEEGPAAPPPTATAHQRAPSFTSGGSRPADLKDLIAGLYGSEPPSSASASGADAGVQEEAEDNDGFGDVGWEFKAATLEPASLAGSVHGDGAGKNEDVSKSLRNNQEDWSSFTSVNGKLNHVHTTDFVGNHEFTEECLNSSYSATNNSSILNLYKVSELPAATYITQNSVESTQSSSGLFLNNEMKAQSSALSDERSKAVAIEGEIQVTENVNVAVELYQHSLLILHTLELASKEERCNYVHAWYSMLLSCAQEMQRGATVWEESCRTNVSDQVISEGGHWFIALGEIYRVAQILYFSLQYFKPWVLADPGILSKMLAPSESCNNAWTGGLRTALTLVAESPRLDTSVAKALMESIKQINELEVSSLQRILPDNEVVCRLTLLPASLIQGMKVIMWNGDRYFIKAANLWANRVSSDPPKLSQTPVRLPL
ncbi:hypothetical protein PR202_gb16431 [Eleusine coracana subsp. coracana]|uniref:Synergin gamma C-terminal domain-containing protein n=1 Tax=Eleusine coracana subsp. coracana TaxID=191504 RepID=A0AAV5EZS4_ELECO|nr:hypothetical protein PR202_gb16431 [Eleusine coracana subsp. coracana]